MAAEKLLAEWFWIDRWMGSSAFLLPMEARGLYREMLSQAWRRGAQLPNDPDQIRRAIGATVGEWRRGWPKVKPFWRVSGELLVNDTQIAVYLDAKGRSSRARARAQAAAQARHGKVLKECPPSQSPSLSQAIQEPPNPLSAKGGGRRYLRSDLKNAERVRKLNFGRCPHDPTCAGGIECDVKSAIEFADRRKAAAS